MGIMMPKTMKIMMMISQSMKITLMMKTMIMKIATTIMMMKIMTTTMMMKITTTLKMITTIEVVEEDEAETEISRETAREDLLQEAEEEVRAADREDLPVQIPADQDQDRVQGPAEEEGHHLQAIQMTIIMITDMIIREDREEAATVAEDQVRVLTQIPEDHPIQIPEAAEETLVQVQDQETAAVQDLVTVLQKEVSHQ